MNDTPDAPDTTALPVEAVAAALAAVKACNIRWASAIDSPLIVARAALAAAAPLLRAEGEQAGRQRTAPLLAAYHRLYEVVWNQTATVDLDVPGYNGLSYDDTNVIDEAGSAVEELLATGAFADILGETDD